MSCLSSVETYPNSKAYTHIFAPHLHTTKSTHALNMGVQISRTAPPASSIAIDAYLAEIEDVSYEGKLGNARFLKTVRGVTSNGASVVIKVFIKPNADVHRQLSDLGQQLKTIKDRIDLASNVMPYSRVMESDRAAYLCRQYLKWNLYDRISTRPFLEHIEKLWISFQLLVAVRNCHSRNVFHGDIKSENVLVTSWNWIYLTDFAPFKPVYLPENDPSQFSFFFDTSRRRSCYVAPERLVANETDTTNDQLSGEMDIFSVGCVIGEIFLEGASVFTLAQMFKYKKGEYDPPLESIDQDGAVSLIRSMIDLDPKKRKSADQYLKEHRGKTFPDYFYYLHAYMESMVRPRPDENRLLESDERISMISSDFAVLSDKLSFNMVQEQVPIEHNPLGLLPVVLNLPSAKRWIPCKRKPCAGKDDDGALIVLGVVCSAIRNTCRVTMRIKGCELLLALGEHVHDEAKLDRCIPHLLWLLENSNDTVQVAAVKCLTHLIELVSCITSLNSHIFPEYILPRLTSVFKRSGSLTRIAIAACLSSLAETAVRFVDMSEALKAAMVSDDSIDETAFDDEAILSRSQDTYDGQRQEVATMLEELVRLVVTDSDIEVRKTVLLNASGLCLSLGRQKTNDVVLSHAITYLNDRDARLRLSLFDSMVGLAPFVGAVSLEQYVVPLMMQSLADPEEYVVHRVLATFTVLCDLSLLRSRHVWELIRACAKFLVHPNAWIRNATAVLIYSASKWMNPAQVFCQLLPVLRPFLECDVNSVEPDVILLHLKPALSRELYLMFTTWASNAKKSAFWKIDKYTIEAKRGADGILQRQIPTTSEDEQWLARLRDRGLKDTQLWILVAYREHIFRIARVKTSEQPLGMFEQVDAVPHNVFFESLEPTVSSASIDEDLSSMVSQTQQVTSPKLHKRQSSEAPGLSLKANAITGAQLAEIYGEINHANGVGIAPIQRKSMVTSYNGNDPNIKKMIAAVYNDSIERGLPEFGPSYYGELTRDKVSGLKPSGSPPLGTLVAHFQQNTSSINCMAASKDSTFFVTASEDGIVRVWDTYRLEKSVINRPVQSVQLSGAVRALCFIGHTYTFCCALASSKIEFIRVDMAAKLGTSGPRYKRLTQVKSLDIDNDDSVIDMHAYESKLYVVTAQSQILVFDSGTLVAEATGQNPLKHGRITCCVLDPDASWMVVGTAQGVLDLWDLRFMIHIRSWRASHMGINCLSLHPKNSKWVCAGTGEVSVWDIENGECREVYRFGEQYAGDTVIGKLGEVAQTQDQSELNQFDLMGKLLDDLIQDNEQSRVYCLDKVKSVILCGGSDKCVRYLDVKNVENSVIVSGRGYHSCGLQHTVSYPAPNMRLVVERDPLQKHTSFRGSRLSLMANEQSELGRNHSAAVTAVIALSKPYDLVVSADSAGAIKVYV